MLPSEALEALARERLPSAVFDYYAGGSGDESTLALAGLPSLDAVGAHVLAPPR